MEEYELVWTHMAFASLEEIVAHLASQSPAAAEKVRDAILQHVEILRSFPYIGPRYARDRRGGTREIVCKKYRIFYRVIEVSRRVEILIVWHSARSEPHLPD